MKKQGSKSDFTIERDSELKKKFFSFPADSTNTIGTTINKVVKTPSSRFWVDPDRARDVLSRYRRDSSALDGMLPLRKAMYLSLYEKYLAIQNSSPEKSMIDCVTRAIYSGAPEFFISPYTARTILSRRH